MVSGIQESRLIKKYLAQVSSQDCSQVPASPSFEVFLDMLSASGSQMGEELLLESNGVEAKDAARHPTILR